MEIYTDTDGFYPESRVLADEIKPSEKNIFSEDNLRLVDISLRILRHSSRLAGMPDTAAMFYDGSKTVRWIQSVHALKSGVITKGLQAPLDKSEKEAATFWGSVVSAIGTVTTPLGMFARSSAASKELDFLPLAGQAIQEEELKHLTSSIKKIAPGVKHHAVMASLEKVRSLDASSSAEAKQAAYLDLLKNVNGLVKVAASALGYKEVADVLGIVAAGCGLVKIFQKKQMSSSVSSSETFAALQAKALENIRSQLQLAREQIEQRVVDAEEEFVIQMLKEVEGDLSQDERSYSKYVNEAKTGEDLAEVLDSFHQRSLQTLSMNGIELPSEATKELAATCRSYSDSMKKNFAAAQMKLDTTLMQVSADIKKGEEALTQLRAKASEDPKKGFGLNLLISQFVKVRTQLLLQTANLEQLKEKTPPAMNELIDEEAVATWEKAVKQYCKAPAINEMHALTDHLLEQTKDLMR